MIGLSNGAATKWTSLAAIVRFNPQGVIDVRAGSTYQAQYQQPYFAGTTYHFRLDVDVTRRAYSVWMTTDPNRQSFTFNAIARDYPFRTEQASVAKLNNVSAFLNPDTGSTTGSIELCGFAAFKDDRTGDNCLIATAGQGFRNTPVATTRGALATTFQGRANFSGMDGVIGFANDDVDAYNDYAPSIRFWTNGFIEARNGDAYRADVAVPYSTTNPHTIHMVMDVPSKTYSVITLDNNHVPVELAANYAFRTQQLGVAELDRLSTVVASASGTVSACSIGEQALLFARRGSYDVQPLANEALLISDGTSTQLLDATHKRVNQVASGGKLAVDRSGNIYIARVVNAALVVDSYTSTFSPRWSRSWGNEWRGHVSDFAIADNGDLLVAFSDQPYEGSYYTVPYHVLRQNPDGLPRASIWIPEGTRSVALGPNDYALIGTDKVSLHGYDLTTKWTRTFNGSFDGPAASRGADGAVVFGGEAYGTIDFGTGPLESHSTPEGPVNGFAVMLDSAGQTVFATKIYTTNVNGIATNGKHVAVTSHLWTQLQYQEVRLLDIRGTVIKEWHNLLRSDVGRTGSAEISANGRVYANIIPYWWWGTNRRDFPFLVGLDPN